MEFGIEKCAAVYLRSVKVHKKQHTVNIRRMTLNKWNG
jgi:hypothetical protein